LVGTGVDREQLDVQCLVAVGNDGDALCSVAGQQFVDAPVVFLARPLEVVVIADRAGRYSGTDRLGEAHHPEVHPLGF